MSKSTDLVERYYAVRKGEFGYLESIELVQNVDPTKWNGFQLTIVFRSGTGTSSPALRLAFKGVRDIRIGDLGGLVCYMLEIRCIEERQLEGLRFEVTESEYDAFSFVCEAFAFVGETRE
ncbi:MAG: hypothetical protein ACO1RA_08670 [Planctomycetaceae bacterium]